MRIEKVWFDNDNIFIKTDVGYIIGNPVRWFPRLANATVEQRSNFEISPFGIHWEELDEDLSLDGFFEYNRKKEFSAVEK